MKHYLQLTLIVVTLFSVIIDCKDGDGTEYHLKGAQITLKCGDPSVHQEHLEWSYEKPNYVAKLSGKQDDNYEIDFEKSSDLKIKKFVRDIGGTYRCSHLKTEEIFSTHRISLRSESIIIDVIRNVTFHNGEDPSITCSASGVPAPKVVWNRDDGKLIETHVDTKGDLVKTYLRFENFSEDDAGIYTCSATNKAGLHNKLTVTVGYIDTAPSQQSAGPATDATMSTLIVLLFSLILHLNLKA